jgi:hypothetical protein
MKWKHQGTLELIFSRPVSGSLPWRDVPCLAIRVGRRCKAVDVIDTIEELLRLFPAPTYLRMDNGPEFIAHALQ